MEEESLKIKLELNVVGDGRTFLNFWNYIDGDDVIAELHNGNLYQDDGTKIDLQQFVDEVKIKFKNSYNELAKKPK